MNQWAAFFAGTPSRFLTFAVVVAILVLSGLLRKILDKLTADLIQFFTAIMPLLILLIGLGMVFRAVWRRRN